MSIDPTHIVELLLLLLIAASLIAMAARRLRIPYTIALVFGGFLIDFLPVLRTVGAEQGSVHGEWLTSDVIFMVFLPGLLFEAGININVRRLLSSFGAILLVAVFGVLIATLSTAYLVHWISGLALSSALVFGALISATDPISVLALFKELGVTKRLAVLVEGESLFNDGTAVVMFQILLAGAVTGDFDVTAGVIQFLVVSLGGAAIGIGLGYVASRVTERIDDPQIEITLTTILAYGSFLLAEHFHLSGVIATVAAGLMIGNYGAEIGMSSRTRVALWSFWEYVGFVINSLIFLLIGIEVHVMDLARYWQPIGLALVAVLAGRALAVYPLAPIASRLSADPIPMNWRHVMFWGGIHGGVSLALALSLAGDFPDRSLVLAMTFGVVAFSIVVQGLTIPSLLRFIGVETGTENEFDRVRVRQMAISSAIDELEDLHDNHVISTVTYERMLKELKEDLETVEEHVRQLHDRHRDWAEGEERLARARLLQAEKTAVQRAVTDGLISQHTAEKLLAQADKDFEKLQGLGPH